jgi:organic hydroperoxide reductase OsmC/OhrA
MGHEEIAAAIARARMYLTADPAEARYRDSPATATLEHGLRMRVEGPDGAPIVTDMVTGVGVGGTAPGPGWMFRAAYASCVATLVAVHAAEAGIELERLQVTVDSESDDRGILGIDPDVPAGPLGIRA